MANNIYLMNILMLDGVFMENQESHQYANCKNAKNVFDLNLIYNSLTFRLVISSSRFTHYDRTYL